MALTEEVFANRDWLHPLESDRGIWLGWQPKYCVLVSGDYWPEARDWLNENIFGLWIDHIFQPEYLVGFEFEDEAVAFKLRWL